MSAAQGKVIITCAVTGAIHTPTMSPHLPITPAEIAEAAIGAVQAGAAIVHLHARNPKDGSPTQDPDMFMQFLPKIDEYYSFYSWFLLGLGLVFQIPVVIFVLARIGLVTPGFLLRAWKWVILGAFVVSAFITPTPDMVTQTALALPMIGLYFFGVAVAYMFGRKRRADDEPR